MGIKFESWEVHGYNRDQAVDLVHKGFNPFVAVFEPTTKAEPSEIESVDYFTPAKGAVGIIVRLKSGVTDYIFSAPKAGKMKYKGMKANGVFAVFRDGEKLIER